MDSFFEEVRDRLVKAEKALEEARVNTQKAHENEQKAVKLVEGYRNILASQTEIKAVADKPIPIVGPTNGSERNKSALARKLILEKATTSGVSAKDIRDVFRAHNLKFNPGYPYNLLHRMKATGLIREENGRYYPTQQLK